MDITQRDRDVIRHLARFRFLRSGQIVKLVGGAPAQMRRRLQVLYHHGYLDRPRCQIDFYHQGGSRPMVYGLASRGAGLMRREFDMPFHRMVWSRGGQTEAVGRLCLEHTLMVSDVLIAAEMATRGNGVVAIDVKVVVQFIMRIDHATRLAIGSMERWETGLRAVERTGDQLRVRRPFQRSG